MASSWLLRLAADGGRAHTTKPDLAVELMPSFKGALLNYNLGNDSGRTVQQSLTLQLQQMNDC